MSARGPACFARFAVATALALLMPLLALGAGARAAHALSCGDIPELTRLFMYKHVRHHALTPELQSRVLQNFLEGYDPQRVLFLKPEAEALTRDLRNVFGEIQRRDCGRLHSVRAEIIQRHQAAEDFVRAFVGRDDYEVDMSAELVLDPEERDYPPTAEAQDALRRTLAHFQISNYLDGGITLEEARERLIHRYELRTLRATERDTEDLYAAFLDSFGRALDPYTSFFSADNYEDFRIRMELSLEGIGVTLSSENGFTIVREIIAGGATDRADALEPDDRIIAVAEAGADAVDIIDMSLRDVVRLIRGKRGTQVELTVLRGDSERLQVTITRDKIDLAEQAAKLRIEEIEANGKTLKLGLLDLPSFYGNSEERTERQGSRDVRRLLEEAKRARVDGVLLDLSRNSGGLLEDAVRITGFFIREGGVVAVRSGARRSRVHRDPDARIQYAGPLVVLTSRFSASASEILSGAVQDYRRAVVVGDGHTFGKGTVQQMLPLPSNELGALKVTTGIFYRPNGSSTQRDGVASDIALPSLLDTPRIGERAQPHALVGGAVPAFRADEARAPEWRVIDDALIAQLAERSAARVAANEEFQELLEEIAERDEDDGRVTLAEIDARRARDEAEREAERAEAAVTPEDGESGAGVSGGAADTGPLASAPVKTPAPENAAEGDDPELTLHQREALRVLADLVALSS